MGDWEIRYEHPGKAVDWFGNTAIEVGRSGKLNWTWRIATIAMLTDDFTPENSVEMSWFFNWDELQKEGIGGFKGHITASYYSQVRHAYVPTKFEFELDLTPIRCTDDVSDLECNFVAEELRDAVLVVGDKRMHVNRAVLSTHSDYFRTLFSSNFMEKSMSEIPIKDVKYEDLARLLSLVSPKPVTVTALMAPRLLKLADFFMMPSVLNLLDQFLVLEQEMAFPEKLMLADKYKLRSTLQKCIYEVRSAEDFRKASVFEYKELSDATKLEIFDRIMGI
ncbi:unnamed protein product [Caenorhabditis sp. 36 PRJEB53466]|nr:unnamed protein product [Caenorhabditis sp. 36 PRJEB53466]